MNPFVSQNLKHFFFYEVLMNNRFQSFPVIFNRFRHLFYNNPIEFIKIKYIYYR